MGSGVWEISMALHEETSTNQNLGRYMNHNCAEYHIPVNAGIHGINVNFVNEDDTISNPLGAKRTGRDRNRRQSSRRRERDLPHHCETRARPADYLGQGALVFWQGAGCGISALADLPASSAPARRLPPSCRTAPGL